MKIYIRHMVCNRCVFAVRAELNKLGFYPVSVGLGMVELAENLGKDDLLKINTRLQLNGFELLDARKSKLLEQIKQLIIQQIHYPEENPKTSFSNLLTEKLNEDFTVLSDLFSELECTTIEQYVILQRLEKVKELLIYNELSLSQIADVMNYSSVTHLSSQFKKITGLSLNTFKALKEKGISMETK